MENVEFYSLSLPTNIQAPRCFPPTQIVSNVQDVLSCKEALIDASCTSELHTSVLVVLLFYQLINILASLGLSSLLLLAALGLLLRDNSLLFVIVDRSRSRLALATFLRGAGLSVSGPALL